MPSPVASRKSSRTIKSTKPLILLLLAVVEVSPKIACNYSNSHELLHQTGTPLGDYPVCFSCLEG